MHRLRLGALILATAVLAATTAVYATHDDECLATKGMAPCVQTFAAELNQALDVSMRTKGVVTGETTKVVPILDIGTGQGNPARATIGAAQVAGPAAAVEKVRAVAVYPGGSYRGGGPFTSTVLVPTDTLEPWKKMNRVVGVGVSAIIFVKGCNAWPDTPPDGCR